MLRILYGTAGTGKSAAIMDEIRRGADSGERDILLVPEQYSHEAERELCRRVRRRPVAVRRGAVVHGACARDKLRVRRRGKRIPRQGRQTFVHGAGCRRAVFAAARLRRGAAQGRASDDAARRRGRVQKRLRDERAAARRRRRPARARWATSCTTWGLYSRRMTALSQTEGQTRPTG